MKRQHSLIWLYKSLVDDGYFYFSKSHELSANKAILHIIYYDFLWREQAITVFRTSTNAYRIYYSNEFLRTRSVKDTLSALYAIRDGIMDTNKLYGAMTLSELKTFDKSDYLLKLAVYDRLNGLSPKG